MKRLSVIFLTVFLFTAAWADTGNRVTVSAGTQFSPADDSTLGGRIAWDSLTEKHVGTRLAIVYPNNELGQITLQANAVFRLLDPKVFVRPYVTVGASLELFDAPVQNGVGANVGAGVDIGGNGRVGGTIEFSYSATDKQGVTVCKKESYRCSETLFIEDFQGWSAWSGVYFRF